MRRVQVSALDGQLLKHLRAAEAGETFEVMDGARAIARLGPIVDVKGLEMIAPARPFAHVRKAKRPTALLARRRRSR
jgi:antitoxin (DNA-binding transcriptional repressor) of toxin-antitoxin stability system